MARGCCALPDTGGVAGVGPPCARSLFLGGIAMLEYIEESYVLILFVLFTIIHMVLGYLCDDKIRQLQGAPCVLSPRLEDMGAVCHGWGGTFI